MNLTETVALANAGDSRAVADLYEEYKQSVYYLCMKLIGGNEDAASGLLQSTFMHAFHKLGYLKDPENFHAWILVTAAKRCKTYLSEKNPIVFLSAPVDSDEAKEKRKTYLKKFNYDNTEDVISRAGEIPAVRSAVNEIIDSVPEAEKFAVILFFYCRMTVEQIAKCMATPVDDVKYNICAGAEIIDKKIAAKKKSIPALASYTGIEEIGAIMEAISESYEIPEQISDTIVAAGMSLISSSAINKNNGDISYDTVTALNPIVETKSHSNGWAIAITVLLALILASVVVTAVYYLPDILEIYKNNSGETDTYTNDITVSDTTTAQSIDQTVNTPSTPISDVTTPVTPVAPVTTEAQITTEAQVTTDGGNAVAPKPVASDYKYKNAGNGTVTITGYVGNDAVIAVPSEINGLSVNTIGDSAFQGNTTLTKVIIPDSVEYIGTYAFLDCTSLAEIEIPASVKKVGRTAFGKTAWLENNKETFVIVGDGVLVKVNSKKAEISIPEGVKYLANVFYYIGTVKEITLPTTVTGIGDYAFAVCISLEKINLPSSLTYIDDVAIFNCEALKTIKLDAGSYAETWCAGHNFGTLISK